MRAHATESIDCDVALAPVDLLACIIASRSTRLGGFDRLAIDDNDGGRCALSFCLANSHDQNTDDLFPQTAVAPRVEAVLHGGKRWKILRQVAPRATCPDQIKQRIEDSARIR